MNVLKVKRLTETAKLPTRAHAMDAGLDIYADESYWVSSKVTTLVRTGIAVEVMPGYQATILPKSGLSKSGVHVYTGTVDAGYVGEILVCAQYISGRGFYTIEAGQKIAQLVITKVELPEVVEADELTAWGTRGANGWGSSGK